MFLFSRFLAVPLLERTNKKCVNTIAGKYFLERKALSIKVLILFVTRLMYSIYATTRVRHKYTYERVLLHTTSSRQTFVTRKKGVCVCVPYCSSPTCYLKFRQIYSSSLQSLRAYNVCVLLCYTLFSVFFLNPIQTHEKKSHLSAMPAHAPIFIYIHSMQMGKQ